MAELQGPGYYSFFPQPKAGQRPCADFWERKFWAEDFWEDGFWDVCHDDGIPQTWDRFHSRAMREDEEMLLLFASFIEIISCRH